MGLKSAQVARSMATWCELTIVVDLSGWEIDDALGHIASLTASIRCAETRILAIVAESAAHVPDPRVSIVEAGAGLNAVERISIAVQMASSPSILVCSAAVQLGDDDISSIVKTAELHDVVEFVLETEIALGDEEVRLSSSRTAVFCFDVEMYVVLRGLDLRITTIRDAYGDFARRARAWGASVGARLLADSFAVAPPELGPVSAQSYDPTRATGIFVNLPRWKYRPFGARAMLQLVRVNAHESSSLDATSAQSVDGYEVVDIKSPPGLEVARLREYLAGVENVMVAPLGPGMCVPPWRLVEQLQQLKSGTTYCVGRSAFILDGEVQTGLPRDFGGAVHEPSISAVSTLLGRSDTLSRLLAEGHSYSLRRAETSKVVACGVDAAVGAVASASTGEVSSLRPYMPGLAGPHIIVFDQYTVGKIDYVDGYSRIAGIVALLSTNGRVVRELAALHSTTQNDIDVLASLGLPYRVLTLLPNETAADVLVREMLDRQFKFPTRADTGGAGNPSDADLGQMFVRGSDGIETWFTVRESRDSMTGSNGIAQSAKRVVL